MCGASVGPDRRPNGLEPAPAVAVRAEPAEPGVRLPQLDHRVANRRAVAIEHAHVEMDVLAWRVDRHHPAEPTGAHRPDVEERTNGQL